MVSSLPDLAAHATPVDVLRDWLLDKPFEWGPALSTRAAFRVLPCVFSNEISPDWVGRYALPLFYSLFVSWSTYTRPIKGHKLAAEFSSNLLHSAALSPETEAFYASGMRALVGATAAKEKKVKVESSARAMQAFEQIFSRRALAELPRSLFWLSASTDCRWLGKQPDTRNIHAQRLLDFPLIPVEFFTDWKRELKAAFARLLTIDSSFWVWVNWVNQVVYGSGFNFVQDNSLENGRARDRQVAVNIVRSMQSQFATRSVASLNGLVAEWVEEANQDSTSEHDVGISIPAQNENAISFKASSFGRIALSFNPSIEALRDDPDSRDRYEEVIHTATDLLNNCRGSNSAGRLVVFLENYLDAAGAGLDNVRASLLVQRGERLRQELLAYQSAETLLPPISDDILLDLRAWQSAHNMFVGLDPALMARDTAQFGPDNRTANVPPHEIKQVALEADVAGLLAARVADVIVEATELAPDSPDPFNRRTVWSFETGRNLIIEVFNLALKHPIKSVSAGFGLGVVMQPLGVVGALGSVAVGAMPAAEFLLSHREWIETRLGDTPTWRALFADLCDWLDRNTPLGRPSKKF